MHKILVINTGSTSTKIAVFTGTDLIYNDELTHPQEELNKCETLNDQLPYRINAIKSLLKKNEVDLDGLSGVAARGGTFGDVKGGAYIVDEDLIEACKHPRTNHASNLSAIIGYSFAREYGCEAYIYDAVCTNEVDQIARITGLSDIKRKPNSHVLNTRACCREVAEKMGKSYEEMTFIVAHMGGGLSLNVHKGGRIIDVVSDDEGPMSPERAGKLGSTSVIKLCFSGEYNSKQMQKRVKGAGGLLDHLGTSDMRIISKRISDGDKNAAFVVKAMAYQVSKDIAALASVVKGKVDSIILTGGCAYTKVLTDEIDDRVDWIAPVTIIPGAREMEALAKGIGRVLDNKEEYRVYGK